MRCYGFPEKSSWAYSTKEPDAVRYRPARNWYRRYLHKCARQHAKKQLRENALASLKQMEAAVNGNC